jgi:hypothetical protein
MPIRCAPHQRGPLLGISTSGQQLFSN